MRRCLIVFLSAQIVFLPTLVYADNNEPVGTYLKKDDKAPYNGLLLNEAAQEKLIADKNEAKRLCEIEKNYLSMRSNVGCDLKINTAKVELDALQKKYDAITKIKDNEIKRLQDLALKSGGDKKEWWIALGVLGGVVLTVASFLLVSQVRKVGE